MFISAGHSDRDPGAVAFDRREADIAVEFRNLVSFYLHRAGVEHDLDGSETQNMPLSAAARTAREHRVAVEFHCNAGPASATGVEVLCAPKDNALAARLCKAIADTLDIRNRGVKGESSGQHSRLAFIRAGGLIVELFFLTNEGDLAAYDGRKWLLAREVAAVLARA